ncbi:MAG TPA: mandelate racemase/muconate lactonizing enzyme family protein [Armatimonadota bacterium]|jgi:D-galactarolactone cycloisomerase
MTITSIIPHLIHVPIPDAFRTQSAAGYRLARQMCLIEVTTDEGVTGFGSCSDTYDLDVCATVINKVLQPEFIGRDPFQTERMWETLYYGSLMRTVGYRGVGIAALSGIDIALWDIKGKALGIPLYQLFGGFAQESVRPYASSLPWHIDPRFAAEEAQRRGREGFSAIKLKIGDDPERELHCIEAIRDAMPDMDILVDADMAFRVDNAIRMAREMEPFGIYWFEEPISIDDIDGHVRLSQSTDIRIATGQNLYTRFPFRDLLAAQGIQVAQADVARAGGFTEVRKIAGMAASFNALWAPHASGDIVTTVANLHLVAATANAPILEIDVTFNPLMADLAPNALRWSEGTLIPPDGPGLGLEIDMEWAAAHPYGGEPNISLGMKPV